MTLGFIGLGLMGEPMALNLVTTGTPLVVWNRTEAKRDVLRTAGATVANNVAEVFAQAYTVIVMLANDTVLDEVLGRGTPGFEALVAGHTVVQMGSTSPQYSKALGADIEAAGGRYVEAPVSGSRVQAEKKEIVVMMAGEPEVVENVRPMLTPMCCDIRMCGPVPNALLMKLAVNQSLIAMVTGLAESVHFAHQHGLDVTTLQAILDAGPMASNVSKIKLAKLVARDFTPQAAIKDVLTSNRLIAGAARNAEIASPVLDTCRALYEETLTMGHGELDMVAVIQAIEAKTKAETLEGVVG